MLLPHIFQGGGTHPAFTLAAQVADCLSPRCVSTVSRRRICIWTKAHNAWEQRKRVCLFLGGLSLSRRLLFQLREQMYSYWRICAHIQHCIHLSYIPRKEGRKTDFSKSPHLFSVNVFFIFQWLMAINEANNADADVQPVLNWAAFVFLMSLFFQGLVVEEL